MRVILNLIWFLLAGLWLAIGYTVAGIICCILVVTIPLNLLIISNHGKEIMQLELQS